MRLIDIDAIPDESYWCRDALAEAIETAPIIDAVPREKYERMKESAEILSKACDEMEYVVRCKDCKYYHPSYCEIWSKYGTVQTREKGFCYMAERGDSDDE